LKPHSDTVCVTPDDAARSARLIAVDEKINGVWNRTAYFQLGACFRKIMNNAIGRVAVLPDCAGSPQDFPSWRPSTLGRLSAVVEFGAYDLSHVPISTSRRPARRTVAFNPVNF
jgi:hypothetical protein